MAVQFSVLPSTTPVFTAPSVSITATDTTAAVSGVSAWNWHFNGTSVSQASSWTYTFFDPIQSTLELYVSAAGGVTAISEVATIAIQDPWPGILSFSILPDSRIIIRPPTKSVAITALDTSPATANITGWSWYFNDALVSNTNEWQYTFFDPITGSLRLDVTSTSFSGISTVGPQTLEIYTPRLNACNDDPVLPEGHQGSTTFNHAITSYELLAERIKFQLGWPATRIELCDEQLYDFIDQGVEWYSKYAGTTEEYLMFNSSRYQRGVGIKMDEIFTRLGSFYSCTTDRNNPNLSGALYDCDLNNYRKVVDVFNVDPVEQTGTDTLFTLDYLFAQQTYFSYLLGSFGFDLITWHILKDWLNLREKLFATKPYVRFDPRSQYLRITPEPVGSNGFIGIIGAHVERSVADLVQERWVQRYALALTKMALAHVRGKFGQVTLFGGGSLNANDLMTQGLDEKAKLEDELMNQFGEVTPPFFYIG